MDNIIIFVDGACANNQCKENIGGWGAVIQNQSRVREIYGGEINTTNQRMELKACIEALNAINNSKIPIELYSDSAYLINCMNDKWYKKWLNNGWKNSKKQPVENKDLWEEILDLIKIYDINFIKVKGHIGIELNERADDLAQKGIEELRKGLNKNV